MLLRPAERSRGVAAAVEFVLIALPFFIVIVGIMEVCWQLANGVALDHAALKGSHFGATGASQVPAWQTGGRPPAELPGSRSEAVRWLVSTSIGGLNRLDWRRRAGNASTRSSFGDAGAPTPILRGQDGTPFTIPAGQTLLATEVFAVVQP
ncbi:TadE family protein [Roseomonas sp. HF4]|uniref:TadE family protein n=1 Tax=Roseomonas sp. HF4 TaxID=2562313 RepID=UPI0014856F98|nr:TadE/TadG family type IV pilus assembly protein [Roseomonas sp. HF4]